jgi:hypothetical protein
MENPSQQVTMIQHPLNIIYEYVMWCMIIEYKPALYLDWENPIQPVIMILHPMNMIL